MLNGFYQTPTGQIVQVEDVQDRVHYQEGYAQPVQYATLDAFDTWTHKPYLRDYPDSEDPLLPYCFELLFNLKRFSQIDEEMEWLQANQPKSAMLLEDLLYQYSIDSTDPQTARVYNMLYAVVQEELAGNSEQQSKIQQDLSCCTQAETYPWKLQQATQMAQRFDDLEGLSIQEIAEMWSGFSQLWDLVWCVPTEALVAMMLSLGDDEEV